jgi:FAD/FMN-containing dehydrogenase
MASTATADYEARKIRLQEQMRQSGNVRLDKQTSNLFRAREDASSEKLSVRDFNHVLMVNAKEGWADVEGMTTYEAFTDETLKFGYMPAVVPQLKTITVGGAVAGIGIESSSFRYGLVHESMLEIEVLLASGETVVCSPTKNADLFYGFPNSYGTFGYALRLKMKIIPVKPYVKIEHTRYKDAPTYFVALEKACAPATAGDTPADFVDGTIFDPDELYITTGTFVDKAPFISDYTYMNIYYKSIRSARGAGSAAATKQDYLSVRDYIWRWDTDWFWCSAAFGAQNPLVRRLFGRRRLNSAVYWKIKNFAQRHPLLMQASAGFSQREYIIQDVDIPIMNAPTFAKFFFENISIRPVWICPFRGSPASSKFNLYSFEPGKLYVNFGFWNSVATDQPVGHYNRMVEAKVTELGGKKGLYSDSFYTPEEFWRIFDKPTYDALKQKYDPAGKLKNLYEKAVKRG